MVIPVVQPFPVVFSPIARILPPICTNQKLSNARHLCWSGIGDFTALIMDIDLIFKIAAIGIIVSILNQVLSRTGREEQATMTTLAGLVVVLMMIAQKVADLFDLVKTLFEF